MMGNGDMDYSFIAPHDTIQNSQRGNNLVCSSDSSTYSPTCPLAYRDQPAGSQTQRESIELEVVAGVVVADVLNHAREALHVVWQQTLLNVVAEQIAEQTAEILMTRI